MLPSETMIWQPEFTDKTLSRKPGAVHSTKLFFSCLRRVHREYNNSESYLRERLFICSYLILSLARL
ncbi:hypothetical protein G3P92_005065 [Escherichia coli]|nr:hypothetical protein [Escherichia coli]EFI3453019.1 hypothetical protein [Escherichia coli]EFI3550280.1 hypothetical protein [Escherichia coli]EFI3886042.1 hypothetical protein [Escherichia coli]EFI4700474.1 hypothetical protein [Escherichia coli]